MNYVTGHDNKKHWLKAKGSWVLDDVNLKMGAERDKEGKKELVCSKHK